MSGTVAETGPAYLAVWGHLLGHHLTVSLLPISYFASCWAPLCQLVKGVFYGSFSSLFPPFLRFPFPPFPNQDTRSVSVANRQRTRRLSGANPMWQSIFR